MLQEVLEMQAVNMRFVYTQHCLFGLSTEKNKRIDEKEEEMCM